MSEKERARQLDSILGFGNYQWFQVNVYKDSDFNMLNKKENNHESLYWKDNNMITQSSYDSDNVEEDITDTNDHANFTFRPWA